MQIHLAERLSPVRSGAVAPQLLSQIFVVSRISAVKIKLLAKLVLQQARGDAVDQQKVVKLLGDGKFETHEIKGVMAALHFILISSARFDVPDDSLASELQQLGLPKEHTDALVSALKDGRTPLQAHLAEASLHLPKVEALHWRLHEDGSHTRAHTVELHVALRDQRAPGGTEPEPRALNLFVDVDTLKRLQLDLRAARDGIEAITK